jgi:hypothetical protein
LRLEVWHVENVKKQLGVKAGDRDVNDIGSFAKVVFLNDDFSSLISGQRNPNASSKNDAARKRLLSAGPRLAYHLQRFLFKTSKSFNHCAPFKTFEPGAFIQ